MMPTVLIASSIFDPCHRKPLDGMTLDVQRRGNGVQLAWAGQNL